MKFSIVVPVYNIKEEYLRKCVESIIVQKFDDYELILVDDGSPDDCGRIIDEYAKIYPSIIPIHQENSGVSVARNNGICKAKGDYIMFVDADDYVDDNILDVLNNSLKNNSCDILFFKYVHKSSLKQYTNPDVIICDKIPENEIKEWLISVIRQVEILSDIEIGSPWGKIFSRDFLEKYKIKYPVNIKKTQDRVFLCYCLEKSQNLCYINYYGYIYNDINENSVCKRYNPEILNIIEKAGDIMSTVLKRQDDIPDEEKNKILLEQSLRFMSEWLMIFLLHKDFSLSNIEAIKEMKKARESKTFHNLLENDIFDKLKIRRYKYGKKYNIIMWMLYKKMYNTLYLFSKLYRLYYKKNNR